MEEAVMLRCEKGSKGCILSIAMPNSCMRVRLWGWTFVRSVAARVVHRESAVSGLESTKFTAMRRELFKQANRRERGGLMDHHVWFQQQEWKIPHHSSLSNGYGTLLGNRSWNTLERQLNCILSHITPVLELLDNWDQWFFLQPGFIF